MDREFYMNQSIYAQTICDRPFKLIIVLSMHIHTTWPSTAINEARAKHGLRIYLALLRIRTTLSYMLGATKQIRCNTEVVSERAQSYFAKDSEHV